MGPHHYRTCGLDIRSDLVLPGLPEAPAGPAAGPADVTITVGPEVTVDEAPAAGRRVLDFEHRGRRRYSGAEHAAGYTLRFTDVCEVEISADLSRVEVRSHHGAEPGVPAVVVAGSVVAFLLSVRGTTVLHASAVEVGGRAIAFVGHSGMGKSTLTVAACMAGGCLVAEDVLAVSAGDPPRCLAGNHAVRLRSSALGLLGTLPDWPRTTTADGREAVRPPAAPGDVPLGAVVIPRPDRNLEQMRVEVIDPANAVFRLVNFPRLLGLVHPAVVQHQFQALAGLAAAVPVLRVHVPWGRPFAPDLGPRLLELSRHPGRVSSAGS